MAVPVDESPNLSLDLSPPARPGETSLSPEGREPVVRMVDLIVFDAIGKRASDIHLETYDGEFRIRYRIDGVLYPVASPPLALRDALISRVKILGDLDIGERRLPQDGRIRMKAPQDGEDREIDLRVSSLPTIFGEKLVLRILDRERLPRRLSDLGLEAVSLERMRRAVRRSHGIVLATGPTGSGKTSTLYTCLSRLNGPGLNINTVEDPVEFNLPGINQVQTKDSVGLGFATALRALLRQDPDILMVGEIRDRETAVIAIRAAITGHLVLSTLHTNDAASAVGRLLDMGIPPFLIANSVNLVCAQRLVRRLCGECKEPNRSPAPLPEPAGTGTDPILKISRFDARGCPACHGTGYRGRIGLFETMEVTETVQQLILQGADAARIRKQAVREGMITLRDSGLEKIRAGVSTVEEVLKATRLA